MRAFALTPSRRKDVMKNLAVSLLVALALAVPAAGSAAPVENINPQLHPNLAEAQRLSRAAFERISAAQAANHHDMEGHAARAKELLDQVNHELKLAAEAANRHAHR
jgi:hypothetical protein